jgi:hypothetical protein
MNDFATIPCTTMYVHILRVTHIKLYQESGTKKSYLCECVLVCVCVCVFTVYYVYHLELSKLQGSGDCSWCCCCGNRRELANLLLRPTDLCI